MNKVKSFISILILLTLTVIVNAIGRVFSLLPKSHPCTLPIDNLFSVDSLTNYHYFFKADSISWVVVSVAGAVTAKDYRIKCLWIGFAWVTLSNMMDELFFNPEKLGYNEIVFSIIIILHIIYRLNNHERSQARNNSRSI